MCACLCECFQCHYKCVFCYSTVICNTELSTAICNPTPFPDLDFRQFLPSVGLLPHPGEILATSYVFGCEGRITQWEAYTSGEGAHPIEFQVWRARTELLQYDLIGVNSFPNTTPTDNILRLSVPEGEQINVSPGDFVGIRTMVGTEGGGFQIQTFRGNLIQYNLTDRGISETPDPLMLGILVGLDCFTAGVIPTNLSYTPIINAVVASEYGFYITFGML